MKAIPVLEDAGLLCEQFGLDPMGAIASGSLLAAVAPESADDIVSALQRDGIASCIIGELTDGGGTELPSFDRDEIVKLFENPEET